MTTTNATALTLALPHRTSVPINATFVRCSICPADAAAAAADKCAVDFGFGSVSPVKLDSSTCKSMAWKQPRLQ